MRRRRGCDKRLIAMPWGWDGAERLRKHILRLPRATCRVEPKYHPFSLVHASSKLTKRVHDTGTISVSGHIFVGEVLTNAGMKPSVSCGLQELFIPI